EADGDGSFNARNESPCVSRPLRPRPDRTGNPLEPRPSAGRRSILVTLDRCGGSVSPSAARQTRNLSLYVGRAFAPGDLRLQTAACQIARAADAGIVHQGPAGGPAS